MRAIKCDRCGNYYDNNLVKRSGFSIEGSVVIGIRVETKTTNFDYDLCDSCVKDLHDFMRYERKEEL